MYYVGPSMHTKSVLQATEDAFYLLPEHRNGMLAIYYLQYAESVLKQMGIKRIGMSDKSPCGGKSLESLMKRMGYKQVAIAYCKEV